LTDEELRQGIEGMFLLIVGLQLTQIGFSKSITMDALITELYIL